MLFRCFGVCLLFDDHLKIRRDFCIPSPFFAAAAAEAILDIKTTERQQQKEVFFFALSQAIFRQLPLRAREFVCVFATFCGCLTLPQILNLILFPPIDSHWNPALIQQNHNASQTPTTTATTTI